MELTMRQNIQGLNKNVYAFINTKIAPRNEV